MTSLSDTLYTTHGGLLPLSTLRLLAESAAEHGNGRLYFTADQRIRIPGLSLPHQSLLRHQLPDALLGAGTSLMPMVTSAPVAGMGTGRSWLREHVFTDLLQGLEADTAIPVLLADATQRYLPTMIGRVHLIAGADEDQWQLRMARHDAAPYVAPGHLRGRDVCEALQRLLPWVPLDFRAAMLDDDALSDLLSDLLLPDQAGQGIALQRYALPPNALALSAPAGGWDAQVLQDIVLFALGQGLNHAALTPWRGLLLPGVNAAEMHQFEEYCLQWRWVPEENPWRRWLLVDDAQESTADTLVQLLYAGSRANPGFSIAVRDAAAPPADVHFEVRLERDCGMLSWWRPARYALHCRRDGDPRDGMPHRIVTGLVLEAVADAILDASAELAAAVNVPAPVEQHQEAQANHLAHRCGDCGTEYDARYGDPAGGIDVGILFEQLPAGWTCPVCGAGRDAFARDTRAA